MSATLDVIEQAMFEQLQTLGPGNADHVFDYVGRFTGEITQAGIDDELLGNAPAALLAFATDDVDRRLSIETLVDRAAQTVGRTTWLVYVIVTDPRGDESAVKGSVGANGILKCVQAAADRLNGLRIAGLFHHEVVRYQSARVRLIARGACYCYALQFTTEREVASVPVEPIGVPFQGMNAGIHLKGEAETPPNPVVQFQVTTTPP